MKPSISTVEPAPRSPDSLNAEPAAGATSGLPSPTSTPMKLSALSSVTPSYEPARPMTMMTSLAEAASIAAWIEVKAPNSPSMSTMWTTVPLNTSVSTALSVSVPSLPSVTASLSVTVMVPATSSKLIEWLSNVPLKRAESAPAPPSIVSSPANPVMMSLLPVAVIVSACEVPSTKTLMPPLPSVTETKVRSTEPLAPISLKNEPALPGVPAAPFGNWSAIGSMPRPTPQPAFTSITVPGWPGVVVLSRNSSPVVSVKPWM